MDATRRHRLLGINNPKPSPEVKAPIFTRESSPSKSVHFGRNLPQRRTATDPRHRSQSPTRPALRRQDDEHDPCIADDGPSAQLQAEMDAADQDGDGVIDEGPERPRAAHPNKRLMQKQRGRAAAERDLKGWKDKSKTAVRQVSPGKVTKQRPGIKKPSTPALSKEEFQSVMANDMSDPHLQVCKQLNDLKASLLKFAEGFGDSIRMPREDILDALLQEKNEHLVRFIGCLAMGGKRGIDGWLDLLADGECRKALLFGIVGRAVKEHVFTELWFGATDELKEILSKEEKSLVHQDGFFRAKERGKTIFKHSKLIEIDTEMEAVVSIAEKLERMMLPLWNLGSTPAGWKRANKPEQLLKIVEDAMEINHTTRKDPGTVYYWPPTFKDEEFEPSRMECLNLKEMIQGSPYDKHIINGIERAVLQDGREHESEAIVRIVCFPGCVAYQKGGGELAQKELAQEREREGHVPEDVQRQRSMYANRGRGPLTGDEGFRTRVLCKSVVLLQWGQQRLLTKEAGTSRHIDAMRSGDGKKYEEDYQGFVELYDLYREKMIMEEQGLEWTLRPDLRRSPSLPDRVNPLRQS